ncbi:MAG: hypothetical protein U9N61_02145 [Euryarchaeota archaeon]|nr:hypothetical protein [Euryarchaeota archaeon]
MYLEIAITDEERRQIQRYAQAEKIRMDRAYAELIRAGLNSVVQ